ncbi:MAG TPA: hypothetical protein VFK06_25260 [Candidatus Angelobacter sp.]|nr:hypothetical protein [Candidatus Angelobacter sp.]
MKRDYVAIANRYAQDVLAGTVATHDAFRLIVQRHVVDLARAENNDPDFPYVFDGEAVARVCRAIELHPPSPDATQIMLEPWHIFMAVVTAGWHRKPNA